MLFTIRRKSDILAKDAGLSARPFPVSLSGHPVMCSLKTTGVPRDGLVLDRGNGAGRRTRRGRDVDHADPFTIQFRRDRAWLSGAWYHAEPALYLCLLPHVLPVLASLTSFLDPLLPFDHLCWHGLTRGGSSRCVVRHTRRPDTVVPISSGRRKRASPWTRARQLRQGGGLPVGAKPHRQCDDAVPFLGWIAAIAVPCAHTRGPPAGERAGAASSHGRELRRTRERASRERGFWFRTRRRRPRCNALDH